MITIIPAIDIIDGKCVRLEQGDYRLKKVYSADPVEIARKFEDAGIKRLHLVDLDGAKNKHVVNYKVLEKIASKTDLVIDFGGGIKSDDDIRIVFESGALYANVGSVAVTNKELFVSWLHKYGNEKVILGADVKEKKIAVSGWIDVTRIDVFDFLEDYGQLGAKRVLCTDISKDGMLMGTSTELYKEIKQRFPDLELIASGGITHIDEIIELNQLHVEGVIIGKAIYEEKILLKDLKMFLD